MDKIQKVGLWIVMGLTTFAFVAAGSMKVMGVEMLHASFLAMGLPAWFGYFIGAAEVAGGIGVWVRKVSAWAAAGLAIIMGGAIYFHAVVDGSSPVPAVVLGVFAVIIVLARRKDALFLNKATSLT